MGVRLGAATLAAAGLGLLACSETADLPGVIDCVAAIAPLESGFGAPGPETSRTHTLSNPDWPELDVSVHLPVSASVEAPVPVVFFAHANDVGDPESYRGLIDHLTSRGMALVFSPYMVGTEKHRDRYRALWSGFEAAAEAYRDVLDLTRLGVVGHSYGAGAVPHLIHRAVGAAGWGGAGAFAVLLAPWFAMEVTPAQLAALPEGVKILVQVYEDDTANDPRIAIALFHAFGVPADDKSFVLVQSDRWRDCDLPAVHTVPQSTGLRARDDALDERAVYRLVDALAAAAFENDAVGRRVALGHGRPEPLEMGAWPDGVLVKPLVSTRHPRPLRPESEYLFRPSDEAGWRAYGASAP
jgi:hypothetical protein